MIAFSWSLWYKDVDDDKFDSNYIRTEEKWNNESPKVLVNEKNSPFMNAFSISADAKV